MSSAQRLRFPALYEQATQLLRKKSGDEGVLESEDLDVSRGYPGITLQLLLDMLDEEARYFEWWRINKGSSSSKTTRKRKAAAEGGENEGLEEAEGMKIYCHEFRLEPLIKDQHDVVSYGALRKKLRALDRACRRILLEVIQASIPACCLCPFLYVSSVPSLLPIPYRVSFTKSRMNLFRLNERIDRGPAISSVCQRRSLGLLNW